MTTAGVGMTPRPALWYAHGMTKLQVRKDGRRGRPFTIRLDAGEEKKLRAAMEEATEQGSIPWRNYRRYRSLGGFIIHAAVSHVESKRHLTL